jgi:hypothetical protein
VIVLQRKLCSRVKFTGGDRLCFSQFVSLFSVDLKRHPDYSAGNTAALASCGISSVLALEISQSWRPARDRCSSPGSDPTDEHREW